ncbi:MAG: zinc ABC transporter substrate-binding protein, partial [Halomonas sp.]|nr:zinc ABC transporter substrate-binding protein [Halomonas sp.]
MRQRSLWFSCTIPFVFAGAATSVQADERTSPINVAVTFSVLGDLVERVAGDSAKVSVLTPIDAEVHEWELTPDNFAALENADVVFYNGYQLEQWMSQVNATVDDDTPVVPVAEAS